MAENWMYEFEYPGRDKQWESGFESYDDAYEAMTEVMTCFIDEEAERHPELSDAEIEERIDWKVMED